MEELRLIHDMLDVDVQKQFDWKACEEEQEILHRKTMINLWCAAQVTKDERFRRMHTVRGALESKAHKNRKQGDQHRERVEPEASGDIKGSGPTNTERRRTSSIAPGETWECRISPRTWWRQEAQAVQWLQGLVEQGWTDTLKTVVLNFDTHLSVRSLSSATDTLASWQFLSVNVNKEAAAATARIVAELLDHNIRRRVFPHVWASQETTSWCRLKWLFWVTFDLPRAQE